MPPNAKNSPDGALTDNQGSDADDARVGEAVETDAGPARIGGKGARQPMRRCIATMEERDPTEMIRFALSPDGMVTPDVASRLPGRGAWVTASREAIAVALKRGAFPRAFKSPAKADPELANQVEALLHRRVLDQLGLARGAGVVIAGYEQVRDALRAGGMDCLIEASDGADDGRHKLSGLLAMVGTDGNAVEKPVIGCFSADELGMALGRSRVIHACLKQGRFARNWIGEVGRLAGFRPIRPAAWSSPALSGENGSKAPGAATTPDERQGPRGLKDTN
jgi:predicted RNA-binding protein YlxR (DUF448 family)